MMIVNLSFKLLLKYDFNLHTHTRTHTAVCDEELFGYESMRPSDSSSPHCGGGLTLAAEFLKMFDFYFTHFDSGRRSGRAYH